VLETLLSSDLNTDNAGSRIEVGSIKIVKPSDYGASNFKMLKQEVREFKQNLGGSVKTFRPNVYT
jgi:hypothetical protein